MLRRSASASCKSQVRIAKTLTQGCSTFARKAPRSRSQIREGRRWVRWVVGAARRLMARPARGRRAAMSWRWRPSALWRAPARRGRHSPPGRRAADLGDACLGGADLVRPGRDAGDHHPVHGALRAARRDGEADAGQAAGAVPRRIVVRRRRTGSSYEFVMRKGVKFHNGEPVTAEDVKFSFERYQRRRARADERARWRRSRRPTRSTSRFKLKEPWPDFLTFYSSASGAGWIVPKKYVEKVGDEGFKKAPIGAGPYKFVSFNPGVELVLEAFDGYWRKTPSVKAPGDEGDPRRGDAAGGAEARRGRHRLFDPRRARRGAASRRRASPSSRSCCRRRTGSISPSSGTRNRRGTICEVRQAANLAIDREGMSEALFLGYCKITNSRRAVHLRLLLAAAGRGLRPRQGQKAAGRGRLPERLRRRAHVLATAPTRTWPRSRSTTSQADRHPHQAAADRARRLLRRLRQQEIPARASSRAASGAFGNAATRMASFVVKDGAFCLRQLSRHRRAVPEAGRRARPQEARRDPRQDAAAGLREGDLRADLAAGLPQRRRAAGRRVGVRPDPRLRLYGALRGPHDQGPSRRAADARRTS